MPATPVHQQIAEDYRAQIYSGALKPGDRLPSKKEIAELWQCSFQPVTKALDTLDSENLIFRRQGVGAFVAEWPEPDPG